MNYLAHGYRFIETPYVLAGTALPDWLRVCAPRVRFRPEHLPAETTDGESPEAQLRRGVLQHLRDDDRFHRAPAFEETSDRITRLIREHYPDRPYLRAHFLAHLLTEILLDAVIATRNPGILDRYYDALRQVEIDRLEQLMVEVHGECPDRLPSLVERFRQARFLDDYQTDAGATLRVGQVVGRVGLPPLPEDFEQVLDPSRAIVTDRAGELLDPAV